MVQTIEKVYLRFTPEVAPEMELICSGLQQSRDLGANHVRYVGQFYRNAALLEDLLRFTHGLGMTASMDLPLSQSEALLPMLRRYAVHLDLGINITPPQMPLTSDIYRGLLANITATAENVDVVPAAISHCLDDVGFGRVKLKAYAHRIGDLDKYFTLSAAIKLMHERYGDRLYCLYPMWLLG